MTADSPAFQPVFIRLRGRVQGPFGLDQLVALHKRGQFGRAHEVSEDRLNWTSAATLDAVFPKVARRLRPGKGEPATDADNAESTVVGPPSQGGPPRPIWHYSMGPDMFGPVTLAELKEMFLSGELKLSDRVWKEGMPDWLPAREVREFRTGAQLPKEPPRQSEGGSSNYCFACGAATDSRAEICPKCGVRQAPVVPPKSRILTALLAIFLGTFGIHRFYLGQALLGILYPLFWCICVSVNTVMILRGEVAVSLVLTGLSGIPGVIAFIEGIVFLCTSDAVFIRAHTPDNS